MGGSNQYRWTSLNHSITVIQQGGIVIAQSPGKTTIQVIDLNNNLNIDQIEVIVSEASQISFLESRKEIIKGEKTFTYVSVFSRTNKLPFTNCTGIQLKPSGFKKDNLQANWVHENYLSFLQDLKDLKKSSTILKGKMEAQWNKEQFKKQFS